MRFRLARTLAGAVAVAGCTDTTGSVSPPTPRSNHLPTLIASTPVQSVSPSAPVHIVVHNAPPTGGVVYVSLPPDAVPDGVSASIRDVESGQVVAAAMVDGGFDPVAITATVGDTLLVAVQSLGSVGATVGYLTVDASRPPVVVRTSPPPKKVDVPLNAFMVVVFNGPLDATTVNTSSVTLWRGTTPVPGTVRFADAAQLRVEFHPDTLLSGDTDYQLIISKGIHDVNGVALDSAITVSFTTDTTAPATSLVFTSVSAGSYYSCGVTTSGAAYCWGSNMFGQLGNGTTTSSMTPVPVAGALTFATLSTNVAHTCGVTTSGAAYCWGSGLLGDGGSARSTPVLVAGGLTFASVSAGLSYSCGVTTAGVAYCWGVGDYGELGGASTTASTPVPVAGGLTFASVSAGGYHSCGLTTTGTAYCWGMNTLGELGVGTTTGPQQCQSGASYACSTTPVPVAGGLTFSSVSSGALHSCGMTRSGAAYCWGNDVHDLLGSGAIPFAGSEQCARMGLDQDWYPDTIPCSRGPKIVGGGLVLAALSTGGEDWFACGLTSTGDAYCWGGDRGTDDLQSTAPVAVAGGQRFKMLSTGVNTTCGISTASVMYCWGANQQGELGDGTTSPSNVPVKVAGQP